MAKKGVKMSNLYVQDEMKAHILTHSGVVVKVNFDVAADDASKGADKVVDLTRVGASNGIGDTDTVNTNAVDGLVDGEKIHQVGSERIF